MGSRKHLQIFWGTKGKEILNLVSRVSPWNVATFTWRIALGYDREGGVVDSSMASCALDFLSHD